uniref:Tumor suppressor 2, mitochondrial calcium regulator b n=1 Tax=Cyprinus carpio TaxID=7962 RepID=A0A8C1YDS9_CYPCA
MHKMTKSNNDNYKSIVLLLCNTIIITIMAQRNDIRGITDGDLAHEFYEETVVTKNGRKKAKLKRIHKNLIPQGIIKLDHPCIHVDFPVVICEV